MKCIKEILKGYSVVFKVYEKKKLIFYQNLKI